MLLALPALLLAPQTLAPPQSIGLPGAPYGLDVADLDGDLDVDAVVALRDSDALYALFNDGAGGFGTTGVIAVGDGPVAVAAGDLDGDGVVDLVSGEAGSLTATARLGTGGGAFGPAHTTPLGAQPTCLALADLDGDGTLDLLVGTSDTESVLALTGNGDGTFGAPAAYGVGGAPFNLSVGDTDGDGDADALVSADFGGTRHLRNHGGGTFAIEIVPGDFGGITDWVDLFDGDQDGDLDLLWVEDDALSADPESRPNNGAGQWTSPTNWIFVKIAYMRIAEAADLDGDGDPDFVCVGGPGVSSTNDTLFLRFGGPGVGTEVSFEYEELHLGGRLADLEAADLDGDGFADVVGANTANATLDLIFNASCPGPPTLASASPAVAPALSASPVVATLDGCGLGPVDQVSVGGAPAAFEVTSQKHLVVTLPPAPQLGPVPVVVTSPLGHAAIDVAFTAPLQPLLVLPGGAALSVVDGLTLQAGAQPGDLAFLTVSPDKSPTSFPGLVDLDIGRMGLSLSLLKTLAIPAKAWREFAAPVPASLIGATFHFQAAVVTPALPQFPLATTNVVTGTVVL